MRFLLRLELDRLSWGVPVRNSTIARTGIAIPWLTYCELHLSKAQNPNMDENERLRELADSTFEPLAIHRDGLVLDANRVFCSLVGRPLSAVRGERFATFLGGPAGAVGVITSMNARLSVPPGNDYRCRCCPAVSP